VHWFDGDVRAQAVVDGRIQKPLDLCLVEGLGHGRGGSEYLAEWLPGCLRRCSAGCTTSWAFCRPTERARVIMAGSPLTDRSADARALSVRGRSRWLA